MSQVRAALTTPRVLSVSDGGRALLSFNATMLKIPRRGRLMVGFDMIQVLMQQAVMRAETKRDIGD
jgi:hypothetical protein